MPSRNLFKAIAAPAVLTLASVAPVLGASQASTASAAPAPAQAPRPNLVFIMADDLGWADLSTGLTNGGHGNDYNETPAHRPARRGGPGLHRGLRLGPVQPDAHGAAHRPVRHPTDQQRLRRGCHHGFGDQPAARRDAGSTRRGRQDRRPGGLHDARRDPPERRLRHRLHGQVPRHGLDRRDRDQPRVRRELGRQPELARHLLLRHERPVQRLGRTGPGHSSPATTPQEYVDQNIAPYSNGVSDAQLDALVGTDKHVTDAQTDATLDFIDRSKDEPFFAWVSEFAPHFPVNDAQARPDLLAKYRAKTPGEDPAKPSYGALTEGVDQSVARIIDYLEATPDPRNGGKPLADNTLVIFTSDNGGEEDPVNSGAFNGPLRADKGQMYEGGVRVPWIVWSKNADLVRGGGRANDTIVNSTDLYTTLASYAQAQLPAGVPLDGIDLKPAFSRGTKINRDHFHHLPGYVGVQGPASSVRDGRWKLYYKYTDSSFELYDLASDIGETTDLAAQKPGLVHQLGQQLIAWLDETDAPLATLRAGQPTRVLENFTGETYANGEVTRHRGDTITIAAGDQVPFVLPRP